MRGIYEAAKTAGSVALELAKMSDTERTALFVQLAKAGIKGLGEMPLNEAARHVGNFIGRLAVDAVLGKGIGTAFSLLKDLKIGAKIIKETVDLSKKIKQTLGNVKIPLSDMKVVSDTMGNKWWIREGELKSLEDLIKPLESRASQTLSGVKKAVNLPAWSKLNFKLENGGRTIHFLNNHTVNGKGYLQSIAAGGRKDLFPERMSDKQIFKAVREAYENSKKVGTQIDPISGDKIVELIGHSSDGMKIRMYINLTLKQLDTAFPQ